MAVWELWQKDKFIKDWKLWNAMMANALNEHCAQKKMFRVTEQELGELANRQEVVETHGRQRAEEARLVEEE